MVIDTGQKESACMRKAFHGKSIEIKASSAIKIALLGDFLGSGALGLSDTIHAKK
jgi:hypothetical protein